MTTPLIYLEQRRNDDWLIGSNGCTLIDQVKARSHTLSPLLQAGIMPTILLVESDPVAFLAGFMAACSLECPVFLGNPHWAEAEWQQVWRLVQPDVVWGDRAPLPISNGDAADRNLTVKQPGSHRGWIMIPTGGSSGQIRFTIHTWDTLMASVYGFQHYFQLKQINACCVLPLHHVSGLMQFLRSFTSGGKFAIGSFKALEAGILPTIIPTDFFLSLVPTQLQRLLCQPDLTHWLAQFQTVLLGGAPAWADLLEQAQQHQIRLALTYGMTETASQIATLKPDDFLCGHRSSGHALPHAHITIRDTANQRLGSNQIGQITVQTASLALGYYPDRAPVQDAFHLDDLGFFDDLGELHIVGRSSNKIITGGENVFPEEVEAAIRATQLVNDVCVLGLPDPQWGEAVTAIYVPQKADVSLLMLQTALQATLSKFKQPKHWVLVEAIARNAQGKINRKQLQHVIQQYRKSSYIGSVNS